MSLRDLIFSKKSSPKAAETEEQTVRQSQGDSLSELAERVTNELTGLAREGKLEYELEEYAASEDFIKLLSEFSTHAAVRIFEAEERAKKAEAKGRESVLEDIGRRHELPRSMRTDAPAAAQVDFSKMSTADFENFKRHLTQS